MTFVIEFIVRQIKNDIFYQIHDSSNQFRGLIIWAYLLGKEGRPYPAASNSMNRHNWQAWMISPAGLSLEDWF